ncbi:10034_t:CDS:2, partial [Dentiscutata heterogama]
NYDFSKLYNNLDHSNTSLNYTNPQNSNYSNQQLSLQFNHYDQIQQSEQNTDSEFEDISMCSKNEINTDIDCSSDNKSQPISTNIDDLSKILIKQNPEIINAHLSPLKIL